MPPSNHLRKQALAEYDNAIVEATTDTLMTNSTYTTHDAEKYRAVREAVIEAVPDIMALEMGCRLDMTQLRRKYEIDDSVSPTNKSLPIDSSYRENVKIEVIVWIKRITQADFIEIYGALSQRWIDISKKDLEDKTIILGRPITLADVLMAVDKVHPEMFIVHDDPSSRGIVCDKRLVYLLKEWDMKNSLEDQDDEVFNSLADVLGV